MGGRVVSPSGGTPLTGEAIHAMDQAKKEVGLWLPIRLAKK